MGAAGCGCADRHKKKEEVPESSEKQEVGRERRHSLKSLLAEAQARAPRKELEMYGHVKSLGARKMQVTLSRLNQKRRWTSLIH